MLDWLAERLRGALNALIEGWIVVVIGIIAFALWGWGQDDVTLPIWLFVLLLGAPLVLVFTRRVAGRPPSVAARHINELERENALYGYYAAHLWDVLQTMQKVIKGDLDVTTDQFVEQGVLGPAREFLMQVPGEHIRLSVLVPQGDEFRMKWAAGHRLASKAVFRMPIAHSFSKHAFESGEMTWSDDVEHDPRFARHPRAERPYSSIISVPIRSGDEVVAVFNVISTQRYAFTFADWIFVGLLGALIDVAWAMGLQEEDKHDDEANDGDDGSPRPELPPAGDDREPV